MKSWFGLGMGAALAVASAGCGLFPAEKASSPPVRLAWGAGRDAAETIQVCRKTGFNRLAVGGNPDKLLAAAEGQGIAIYFWDSNIVPRNDAAMERFCQRMTPEEERLFLIDRKAEMPDPGGYQFGGEPLPEHHEVLATPLLCFHRPEVVAYRKAQIRKVLEEHPGLAGIAFDFYGYQNYHCCYCPCSVALFERERAAGKYPDMSRNVAWRKFSEDTLIAFYNEMADYVRSLNPKLRTAAHVYPVYLPDPLYGNRLDIDECAQTVAWFFPPYWSKDKIIDYTRIVVRDADRYYPRQIGVPFIGVYMRAKPVEQFRRELETIRAHSNGDLSLCGFADIVADPAYQQALIDTMK